MEMVVTDRERERESTALLHPKYLIFLCCSALPPPFFFFLGGGGGELTALLHPETERESWLHCYTQRQRERADCTATPKIYLCAAVLSFLPLERERELIALYCSTLLPPPPRLVGSVAPCKMLLEWGWEAKLAIWMTIARCFTHTCTRTHARTRGLSLSLAFSLSRILDP